MFKRGDNLTQQAFIVCCTCFASSARNSFVENEKANQRRGSSNHLKVCVNAVQLAFMEININDQMQPLNFNEVFRRGYDHPGDRNTGAFRVPIDFIRQPLLQSMCNVIIFSGKDI